MLPLSHVAYTWLALSVVQDAFDVAPEADYRMIALAAMGPDLIDKPLATVYFIANTSRLSCMPTPCWRTC